MSDSEQPPSSSQAGEPPPGALGEGGEAEPTEVEADDGAAPTRVPQRPRRSRGRKGRSGRGSFLRELPVLLLIALVLAFLLRTFVLQVFYIPSSSMEPTLQINDRMVVEKVTYRFREPRRGEIAVFEGNDLGAPEGENGVQRVVRGVGQFIGIVPASARDFVKRVVGLPGDEIVIEDGQVFVNGTPLEEPYVHFDDHSDFGPVTVPEGRLFFLGDNRPNSSDSRRSLGFVERDHLVGRAAVVIWPPGHGGMLTGEHHEVADAPAAERARDEGTDGVDDEATPHDDGAARERDRELEPAF